MYRLDDNHHVPSCSAVTLHIASVEKSDAGEWSVRADNAAGHDSVTIQVSVADVPEPPRFPQIENVLESAVVLSWKVGDFLHAVVIS